MTKRQKLIHLHSSGVTNVLNAVDLAKGEIAVRHATEKPELYIRKEDDTLATFIDEKAISKKITDVTDVISSNLEALSSATENLVSTVVSDYVTSESLEETLKGVTNDINATIETLSGRVDAHDVKFTNLEKDLDEYKASVVETYATKTELGIQSGRVDTISGAVNTLRDTTIPNAKDAAIKSATDASSAYTDAKVAKVQKDVDANASEISNLWTSAATKVELVAVSGLVESTFNAKINDITKDGGAIDTKVAAAKVASSAYTDAEIEKVEKLIDAEKARINELEVSAATKVELGIQSGRVDTISGAVNTLRDTTIPNAKAAAIKDATDASSAYTDAKITKVQNDVIAPLDTKVTTLIGSDSGKTARAIAEDVVKFVVSGASEAFDTLKEVEDWIVKDEKGTADLIQTVTDLGVIANFASGHTVELEKVFDDYKESVGEIYATKTELGTQSGRIDTLVDNVNTITGTTIPNAKDAAIKSATDASSAYTDAKVAKVQKDVDANASEISNLWTSAATKVELGTQSGRVDTISGAVNTLRDTTIPNAKDAAIKAATDASSGYTDAKVAKVQNDVIAPLDARVVSLESISGLSYTAIHEIDYNVISGNGFSVKTAKIESATTGAVLSMEFDLSELVIDCGEF